MFESREKLKQDPFFGGFADFASEKFPDSIDFIVTTLGNANRYQDSDKSFEKVLKGRKGPGKAILKMIKEYIKHFRKESGMKKFDLDLKSKGTSGHIQEFYDALLVITREYDD